MYRKHACAFLFVLLLVFNKHVMLYVSVVRLLSCLTVLSMYKAILDGAAFVTAPNVFALLRQKDLRPASGLVYEDVAADLTAQPAIEAAQAATRRHLLQIQLHGNCLRQHLLADLKEQGARQTSITTSMLPAQVQSLVMIATTVTTLQHTANANSSAMSGRPEAHYPSMGNAQELQGSCGPLSAMSAQTASQSIQYYQQTVKVRLQADTLPQPVSRQPAVKLSRTGQMMHQVTVAASRQCVTHPTIVLCHPLSLGMSLPSRQSLVTAAKMISQPHLVAASAPPMIQMVIRMAMMFQHLLHRCLCCQDPPQQLAISRNQRQKYEGHTSSCVARQNLRYCRPQQKQQLQQLWHLSRSLLPWDQQHYWMSQSLQTWLEDQASPLAIH